MSVFKIGLRVYILFFSYLLIILLLQFIHTRSSQVKASVYTENSQSQIVTEKKPIDFESNTQVTPTVVVTKLLVSIEPTVMTVTSAPTDTPEPLQHFASTGNGWIDAVNSYRVSKGFSALSFEGNTCAFASTRSSEIVSDFTHNGFVSRRDGGSLPYPSYSNAVENIAIAADGQNAIDMWKGSPTHDANLLADITFGCIASNGSYFVFEGWKN